VKRAAPDEAAATSAIDAGSEFAETISRPHFATNFARVAPATMSAPRSKPGSRAEQQSLALAPLLRDRTASALARSQVGATQDLVTGLEIPAKASPVADADIREQFEAQGFGALFPHLALRSRVFRGGFGCSVDHRSNSKVSPPGAPKGNVAAKSATPPTGTPFRAFRLGEFVLCHRNS
jgi:hypothetical protein